MCGGGVCCLDDRECLVLVGVGISWVDVGGNMTIDKKDRLKNIKTSPRIEVPRVSG